MTWFRDFEQRCIDNHNQGQPMLWENMRANESLNRPHDNPAKVTHRAIPEGQIGWVIAGVMKLDDCQNDGKNNCHFAALTKEGNRQYDPHSWFVHGYHGSPDLHVMADKPENEPMGNFPMWANTGPNWLRFCHSGPQGQPCIEYTDYIENLRTDIADETNPNCRGGNTWGHHGYYVVFVETEGPWNPGDNPPPTEPPPTEPPPTEPPPTEPPTGPVTLEGTFTGAGFSFTGTFRGDIK